MSHTRVPILALIVLAAAAAPTRADGDIVMAAQETQAAVAPAAADRRLVDLPELEFALRAAIRCKGRPVSLTFSVADTFVTVGAIELGKHRAVESVLAVPPGQLALAASSRFCVADDGESIDELRVPGFATAHASLQCEHEQKRSMHFASAPLQIRLNCARAPEQPQDPSEPPAAR